MVTWWVAGAAYAVGQLVGMLTMLGILHMVERREAAALARHAGRPGTNGQRRG